MSAIVIERRFSTRARLVWLGVGLGSACAFVGLTIAHKTGVGWLDGLGEFLWRLCAVGSVAALIRAIFHRHEKWLLDDTAIRQSYRDAFGARSQEWPMSSVAAVRIKTIDGESFADQHRIEITLVSGKRLKLPVYRRRARAEEIAAQIETWRDT